jgi:WD40 repeat protein
VDPVELERELAQIGRDLTQPSSPPPVDPEEVDQYEDRYALRLYDLENRKWVRKFRGHSSPAGGAAFFPDGRRILSGGQDQTLRIWDVGSGQELRRLEGHQRPICCIALSPDGRLALSGDYDGEVRLWKLAE